MAGPGGEAEPRGVGRRSRPRGRWERAESEGAGGGKKIGGEREQMGRPAGLPAATGQKREGEFFFFSFIPKHFSNEFLNSF